MTHYPASILNLIKQISKLPGIGEKTAERLALHILRSTRQEAQELAFGLSDEDLCKICSDPGRDDSVICVVEQPADMVAVEKSGAFRGKYHILSGALSPMNGIGPDDLRIGELLSKIGNLKVKEVVLATGTNVEGEATAAYLSQRLETYPVKVTRIASGVPVGGDLKYVDQVTLKKALEARHNVGRE
jgi:recombination protein RecR